MGTAIEPGVVGPVRLANGNRLVIPIGDGSGQSFVVEAGRLPAAAPRRTAEPVVDDAPGLNLRPDPLRARTGAELVAALLDYREWAGEPSFKKIACRSGQMVSASTLHRALTGKGLPSYEAVMAVIIGCGGSEKDRQRFASAWRTVRKRGRVATPGPPRPLRVVPAGS